MEFSELETGQTFVILGKKTPLGFITLEDGLTHYGLEPDTPVQLGNLLVARQRALAFSVLFNGLITLSVLIL